MQVARFSVVELEFTGPATPIPADRTPLTARFEHGAGTIVTVPGFWDDGSRYLVRFAPELEGDWSYTVDGEALESPARGDVHVTAADEGERGPVRVAGTYHFAHADGTPFRPVGATAYNWLHQPEPRFGETIESLEQAGFNKLRFMVFPQSGDSVDFHPTLLPFEKDAAGEWDVTRPVPEFFQRLDAAVLALADAGIEADVLIFNSYDNQRFGLDTLTAEQDSVYLRYLVARLSAYSNVWWSLCNEFDILTDRPAERWDAAGLELQAVDPHDHLRSIHNWIRLFDNNRPWVTHASIQNGSATTEFGRASLYRDVYEKPVVLDEIKYEGDFAQRWGNLSAEQLVHQFWITTVAGCYASHGESFVIPGGSLHMVEGGRLQGESPARLSFLRDVLEAVDGVGLDPIDKWDDPEYVAGIPRSLYVRYLGLEAPAAWTFRLPQGNLGERLEVGDRFEVDVLDTWNMTVTPVGRTFVLDDVRRNDAYATESAPVELPVGEALALRIRRV